MTLMLSLTLLGSCATGSPPVVIKGVDYDSGTSMNEPSDRSVWMWMTYDYAKRYFHWKNHKGEME